MEKNIIRKTQIFVYFEECWTECNEWLLNSNQSRSAADFSKAIFYSIWMPWCFCFKLFWRYQKTWFASDFIFQSECSSPCHIKKKLHNTRRPQQFLITICNHFYLSLEIAFISFYGNLNEEVPSSKSPSDLPWCVHVNYQPSEVHQDVLIDSSALIGQHHWLEGNVMLQCKPKIVIFHSLFIICFSYYRQLLKW